MNFKQPISDAVEHATDDSSKYYTIDADGAIPNLVAPYRRKILARLKRNDGWAVTNLEVRRELVTMQSKIRGGGNNKSARYQSATEFYATAPVRGLVYTVVHDPPGGDSVASIMKGTEITLELSLETTRSASGSMTNAFNAEIEGKLATTPKVDAGSSYVNVLIDLDPNSASAGLGANRGRRLLDVSSKNARSIVNAMKKQEKKSDSLPLWRRPDKNVKKYKNNNDIDPKK